jgi:hypothetical protein
VKEYPKRSESSASKDSRVMFETKSPRMAPISKMRNCWLWPKVPCGIAHWPDQKSNCCP